MKKTYLGGTLLVAAAAFLASPSVQATCNVTTQSVAHVFNGFITDCPDANQVQAFVYLLGSQGTVNSVNQDIICESDAGSNGLGQDCQPGAGVVGDGNVTILTDWGSANTTILGCPNPAEGPDGSTPIGVQVICNDGKSVYFTMGYAGFISGFAIEAAYPGDGAGGAVPSVPAVVGPTPIVSSIIGDQVCARLLDLDDLSDCTPSTCPADTSLTKAARGYYTDCDTAAFGYGITCDNPSSPRSHPGTGRGRLYMKDAPCNMPPDPRLSTGWTGGIVPDAITGIACINAPRPMTGCTHIGATQSIDGVETLAVSGSFQSQTAGAATDRFQIDAASFKQSNLILKFSTINESALVGFNLYAGKDQLNAMMIAAQGGSRGYTFESTRSALKGNKAVVLEGVFSDGTKRRAPAFQVK
jgi:hypothetical protein